jgi:DNA polymerase-4/DNA polymerase V
MILHLDGDGFFAACELLRRRDLRGKPVVVGEDRGIATAMNREAKQIGIVRGMPIFQIRELHGNTVAIVPSHFDLYEHISQSCYTILKKHAPVVERYSIDECFVDLFHVSESEMVSFVSAIQKELYDQLGVTYSCGIGRTKALAKLGSKYKKPYGLTYIPEDTETTFLESISVLDVWGIGRALGPKLQKRGIYTARAFRDASRDRLDGLDMKGVLELQDELRGFQRFITNPTRSYQKSVESTRSFGAYSKERSFVFSELSKNIEVASERLLDLKVAGIHISIFLKTALGRRYAECDLPHHTQDPRILIRSAEVLFDSLYVPGTAYKATGISIHRCIPISLVPNDLFGQNETYLDTFKKVSEAVQKLRGFYGGSIVMLGSSLQATEVRSKKREVRDQKDPYIYGLPLPYLGEVC